MPLKRPMGAPRMPPLQRPQALADQVYLALRDRLRSGAIRSGEVLQEVPVAAQLGVSRTPVREAMARLASEGLLATDRRSFAVPALDLADVDDIYELRFLLEPAAMRRIAARAAEPGTLAPIEAALAAATAAHRAGDAGAFREANVAYRRAWLKLVPNSRLVRIIELYADHMQHIRTLTLGAPGVRTIVLRGLQSITTALAAGDAEAAEQCVRVHLQQARLAFVNALGLAERSSTNANGKAMTEAKTEAKTKARAKTKTKADGGTPAAAPRKRSEERP